MNSIGDIIHQNKNTFEAFAQKANGYFTKIPNSLLMSGDITIFEKMIWIVLKKYQMRNNSCWPSISTIGKNSCCGNSSVKKAIKGLTEKGMIIKLKELNHKSNVYKIIRETPRDNSTIVD